MYAASTTFFFLFPFFCVEGHHVFPTKEVEAITRVLSDAGMRMAYASGQKLQDLVRARTSDDTRRKSVMYPIPCAGCSAVYYGETARGIERRLKEHRSDLQHHRTTNSLVLHAEEHEHLPRWENAAALHTKMEKRKRKLVEAAYIATSLVTNYREGFVSLYR